MNGRCCCQDQATNRPSRRRVLRWLDAVGWVAPATALALMPKCPMCVAAYVALFSGIGISLPAATAVRGTLVVLSVASIAFMAARTLARAATR